MSAVPEWSRSNLWDLFDLSPIAGSDLQAYLETTLAKCVAWFRASGGSIFLAVSYDTYELKASFGAMMELPTHAVIHRGQGIGGIVAQSGRGKIINDPHRDPELAGVKGNSSIVSSMVIPLVDTKRKTIGILNISRRFGELHFGDDDLEQAEALGAHVALSVSNAQMVATLHETINEALIANEKLRTVLDSVAGSVVVVDANGAVVNHNQSSDRSQLIEGFNHECNSVFGLALRATTKEVIRSGVAKTERVFDKEFDRWWVIEGLPLSSGGAVMTVQETTDDVRRQREASRTKRLAEIGQMTAAIAHEIRNPLTGIRSAAQMIRQDHAMVDEFIPLIEEEALKLNRLCEEFLEFARPIPMDLNSTTLADAILPVVKLIKPCFDEKGIQYHESLSTNQPTLQLDVRRVGQVVHNLLRNACEATPSGGSVRLEIDADEFRVIDTGSGISQEAQERLFSPFFTTKSDGTGLGLCTSRKIIDAHGGTISVTSEPGHGTTFTVILGRTAV